MRLIPFFVAVSFVLPAGAKWKPRFVSSPYASWYESQRGCGGGVCCSKADAEAYYGNVTYNSDGSVTLDNGARIPSCSVLRGPNPTGHAVWSDNGPVNFCFAPADDF